MAHTADYGTSYIYTNCIAVLWNTCLLLVFWRKAAVYVTLTEVVLWYMICLCSNERFLRRNDKLLQRRWRWKLQRKRWQQYCFWIRVRWVQSLILSWLPWSIGAGSGDKVDGVHVWRHTIYLRFEICDINCCMLNLAFWTGVAVTYFKA